MKHGPGIYSKKNGDVIMGEWLDDELTGCGRV